MKRKRWSLNSSPIEYRKRSKITGHPTQDYERNRTDDSHKSSYEPTDEIEDSCGKRYNFIRFLGAGSFGTCFLVYIANEVFACKIQRKSCQTNTEVRVHSSLSHKNIVQFIDTFTKHDKVFIVLEYCEHTMERLFECRQTMSLFETRYFLKHIAEGVAYLHDKQIIHRDMKLDNVLLDDRIRVKIADLGNATHIRAQKYKQKKFNVYAAPELRSNIVRFACDVWAIGVIAYELFFGVYPFTSREFDKNNTDHQRVDYFDFCYEKEDGKDLYEVFAAIFRRYDKRMSAKGLLKMDLLMGQIPEELPDTIFYMAVDE